MYSRFLAPVVVARLLKDITIKAEGGHIHAICGVTGSGKTTLLKTISGQFKDGLRGTISVDNQIINKSAFDEIGILINSKVKLPKAMTVARILHLTAERIMRHSNVANKVMQVMREMEILGYKDSKCGILSESAKRRTLLAVAMVSDPKILIFDDLLTGLEPLSAYQIMLCLQSMARNKQCIVVISLRNPRSDIYQMVDRMTILFYGQVFYSGLTKNLPEHFSGAGFPCPSNENPAIYYLSLATLDRETEERKAETKEKAIRLVEYQKGNSMDIYAEPELALRYVSKDRFRKKHSIGMIWYYLKCSFLIHSAEVSHFFTSLLVLPAVNLIICVICSSLSSGYWHTPYNAASMFQILWFASFLLSGLFVRSNSYKLNQLLNVTDPTCSMGLTSILGFILIQVPLMTVSSVIGSAISYWMLHIPEGLLSYCLLLIISGVFGIMLQMILISLISNENTIILWLMIISLISVLSGGFLISLPFSTTVVQWISVINPLKYSNVIYSNDILSHLSIEKCRRSEKQGVDQTEPEKFCRWKDTSAFLEEIYGDTITMVTYDDAWTVLFMQLLTLFVILLIITFVRSKLRK